MTHYVILYWDADALPGEPPLAFICDADNMGHAEEQCANAYPECAIAWGFEGRDVNAAFADYWS